MSDRFGVVATEPLLSSFVFDVVRNSVSGLGQEFTRDVVVHKGAVGIVAQRADGRVGLLRQYRAAFDAEIWEIPAGTLDVEGEPLLEAAQRELAEELGASARTWLHLGTYMVSPGWTNQVMHLFKATELELFTSAPEGPEETAMSVHWLTLDEIKDLLKSDEPLDYSLSMGLVQSFGAKVLD